MRNLILLAVSKTYYTIKIVIFVLIAFPVSGLAEAPILDQKTGLIIAKGYKIVDAYCIGCHTGKRIIEYRGERGSWSQIIKKMQKIGQWQLDKDIERQILDYLSKNYLLNSSVR